MGCVFCNITNVEHFGTEKNPQPNPFYCKTDAEREEFLNELAADIVSRHPEFIVKFKTPLKTVKLLTRRQIQVLELAAAGKTSKETGFLLYISVQTVKSHREKIFIKLKAVDITQAVAIAIRRGIIE